MQLTLEQIIWEEVRNYRLAKKAQQLSEQITFTPVKTPDTKSTSTQKPTATTTTQTPTTSSSPFKTSDEARQFYNYAINHVSGAHLAKPDPNDQVLKNLYKDYSKDYKDFIKKDAIRKKDTNKDGGSTGATSQPVFGIQPLTWFYIALGAVSVFLGAAIIRTIFRGAKGIYTWIQKLRGKISEKEIEKSMETAANNMSEADRLKAVKDRGWFGRQITNMLGINRRQVQKSLKEMGHSVDIDDNSLRQINKGINAAFNQYGMNKFRAKIFQNVQNSLKSGKKPDISFQDLTSIMNQKERKLYLAGLKQEYRKVGALSNITNRNTQFDKLKQKMQLDPRFINTPPKPGIGVRYTSTT